jgi:hypothetical protein
LCNNVIVLLIFPHGRICNHEQGRADALTGHSCGISDAKEQKQIAGQQPFSRVVDESGGRYSPQNTAIGRCGCITAAPCDAGVLGGILSFFRSSAASDCRIGLVID